MRYDYKITALVSGLKTYFKKYENRFSENVYYEICEVLDAMLLEGGVGNKSNNSVFQKIKRTLNAGINQFTFVLGAGVSNDFGIPNWEELIYRLNFSGYWERTHCDANYEIPDKFVGGAKEKLKTLFQSQNNLYEWAQYAENNFNLEINLRNKWLNVPSYIQEKDLDNRIYSAVKQSLFYEVKFGSENYNTITAEKSAKTKYGKNLARSSLSCIGKIICKYKIDRVITYNYDDCLEYVIGKYCLSADYIPIFDKEQLLRKSNKYAIYHVHGFIPYFSEFQNEGERFGEIKTDFDSWDGRRLILTEVSYDEMTDEIYKWRNAVQVDTFLRYNCFFVGFSATDINFKRIVKQLSRKIVGNMDLHSEHYIAVCLDDYIKQIPQRTKNKFYNIDSFIKGLKNDKKSEELYPYIASVICMLIDRKKYLERYNITPLFTTISDLPKLLSALSGDTN